MKNRIKKRLMHKTTKVQHKSVKKLLTEIERSEFNNPLLTAALAEVDKLTLLVSQIRCLVENEKIKCEENGQVRFLTGKEADAAKIEILNIMLYPYD